MPSSSINDAMIRCMTDKGWDPEMDWGGTIGYGQIPDEQHDIWNADNAECAQQTGWGDLAGLTPAQVAELYELEVRTHECLVAAGHPSAEPPTSQRYHDTFRSGEQYYAIGEVLDAQGPTPEIISACPPPTWFMNWD